jgi:transcriptional regulator with XRE-family HTH domain
LRLEELRNKRKAAGFTQKNLATMVGIGRSTLSLLENGKRKPSYDLLKKIALALGETIEIN